MNELAKWFWEGMLWSAAFSGFMIGTMFLLITLGMLGAIFKKKKT